MFTEARPPRPVRFGWTGTDWADDERVYAALLDSLTRDRIEMQAVDREMTATARADGGAIEEFKEEVEHHELDEARRELGSFRAAIEDVRARGGEGWEVAYDSGDPTQDDMADALIQYLVRPGYASVRTEEPKEGRYVYHVQVDWPKLRLLAQERGFAL